MTQNSFNPFDNSIIGPVSINIKSNKNSDLNFEMFFCFYEAKKQAKTRKIRDAAISCLMNHNDSKLVERNEIGLEKAASVQDWSIENAKVFLGDDLWNDACVKTKILTFKEPRLLWRGYGKIKKEDEDIIWVKPINFIQLPFYTQHPFKNFDETHLFSGIRLENNLGSNVQLHLFKDTKAYKQTWNVTDIDAEV